MDEDFTGTDDTETGALGALASLDNPAGTAPDAQLMGVRAAMKRSQDLQLQQQAFYDRMAKQLEERRTGPSTSEQLFELSAALARPTTVRGFSGVLNNVMPVLQQQAKATREGKESRMEALNALQLAQMKGAESLAGRDLNTQIALAKITAAANKPVAGINVDNVLTNPYTGERIGGPAPKGVPAPRTVTVNGVTYLTDASGAPKTPVPQRGSFRPATPDEAAAYGVKGGQINTATGEFKPTPPVAPRSLKPAETTMLKDAEDIAADATATIRTLQDVMRLSPLALEGSLTGPRKSVGAFFSSEDPKYVNAEQIDNAMKGVAVGMLKSTFPGSISNDERKMLVELQGSASLPRSVREKLWARSLPKVQRILQRNTERIEKVRQGYYTERTEGAPVPAKPRVLNWSQQ